MQKWFAPVLCVPLALVGCSGTPSAPTQTAPAVPQSQNLSFGVSEAESVPNVVGTWNVGGAQGDFRVRPFPPQGAPPLPVEINMCHSTDPAPGFELHYKVTWGDGSDDGHGACRYSHLYNDSGTFTAVACVWDEIPAHAPGTCHTFSIAVANAKFCHSINAGIAGACPSGATQFCEPVPIVSTNAGQAMDACDTCLGSACATAPIYNVKEYARTGFLYSNSGFCAGRAPAGTIIDPNCTIYGRWAQ